MAYNWRYNGQFTTSHYSWRQCVQRRTMDRQSDQYTYNVLTMYTLLMLLYYLLIWSVLWNLITPHPFIVVNAITVAPTYADHCLDGQSIVFTGLGRLTTQQLTTPIVFFPVIIINHTLRLLLMFRSISSKRRNC